MRGALGSLLVVVVAAAVVVVVVACGDNIRPGGQPDASPTTGAQPGAAAVCGDGKIAGDEKCDDGLPGDCCSACMFVAFGNECRASAGTCDVAEVCDGMAAACPADAKAQ